VKSQQLTNLGYWRRVDSSPGGQWLRLPPSPSSRTERTERASLATGLNTPVASPTLASWRRHGATPDIGEWLTRRNGDGGGDPQQSRSRVF